MCFRCTFLPEKRLVHSDDNKKYEIPGFEVSCRNDKLCNSATRPPHGLISYVRDTVQILGHEIQTSPKYDSIFFVYNIVICQYQFN